MPLQYALCDLTANTRSLVRVTRSVLFRAGSSWPVVSRTLCIDTRRLWWSPLLCATGLIHNLSQGTAIYCRKCCPTVSPCGRASGIKETGPIRFQGGCHRRRLNQALSGLCLTPSCSCWVCFVFFCYLGPLWLYSAILRFYCILSLDLFSFGCHCTSTVDWLERLVFEIIYNVSVGTLNPLLVRDGIHPVIRTYMHGVRNI